MVTDLQIFLFGCMVVGIYPLLALWGALRVQRLRSAQRREDERLGDTG